MADVPPKKSPMWLTVLLVILINIAAMFVLMTWQDLAMLRPPETFYTFRLPAQALMNLILAYFAAKNKQLGLMMAHAFFFFLPLFVFTQSFRGP